LAAWSQYFYPGKSDGCAENGITSRTGMEGNPLTKGFRCISLHINSIEEYGSMAATGRDKPLKFNNPQHDRLLSIFFTGILLRKRAREFFSAHHVTDVQFNILSLIYSHGEGNGGLSQVDLSRILMVNRSNITSLVDRMERAGLVRRAADPGDRRRKVIELTPGGRKALLAAEDVYTDEVRRIMSVLSEEEQKTLEGMLSRLRRNL
jgi:DNA-binding MarR family transcriptional regulator